LAGLLAVPRSTAGIGGAVVTVTDPDTIIMPKRPRGRPSAAQNEAYEADVERFCTAINEIASTLEFAVSSRGWCYILEEHGLVKGDFDAAQRLINDCRKSGQLPIDICAIDERRSADNLDDLDEITPDQMAARIVDYIRRAHETYTPFSFWDDQEYYVEMVVEKIDLKNLFGPVCEEFHIPIQNAGGGGDLHLRAGMMKRFARWEAEGKKCVLLYCGDFDPGGLHISDSIHSNLEDMAQATDWWPDDLIIERFGLTFDFIEEQGLSWIENLETSSGGRLDDPRHPDHNKPYVQDYLKRYCPRSADGGWIGRKVEANALVVRPEAGRDLCRQAILRYVDPDSPNAYEDRLAPEQDKVRRAIRGLIGDAL
jgi:hypothetical protein